MSTNICILVITVQNKQLSCQSHLLSSLVCALQIRERITDIMGCFLKKAAHINTMRGTRR